MNQIKKNIRIVNGETVLTRTQEIVSSNILEIEVGTNGFHGGDTGHGSRTYLRLNDLAGTDLSATVLEDTSGSTEVILELGGDCELETFIRSLEFAVSVLKEQVNSKF